VADHDYKQGGWRDKYVIFKKCTDCDGTGKGPCGCRSAGECHHLYEPVCETCKGKGYVPVDPAAVYFVLRLDEDPYARIAMAAYAREIREENRALSEDIRNKLDELRLARIAANQGRECTFCQLNDVPLQDVQISTDDGKTWRTYPACESCRAKLPQG